MTETYGAWGEDRNAERSPDARGTAPDERNGAILTWLIALAIGITSHSSHHQKPLTRTLAATRSTQVQQIHSLRGSIVAHRQRTWRLQTSAGRSRTRSSHAERHTTSIPFLWWIDHLWQRRQHAASKLRPRTSRVSRGSLRSYAGCLAPLIDREDPSWDPTKWNSGGSGAYGLPQALPGSKMASAGADWATNAFTQIRWMRGYVTGRYGSCAAALAHSYAYGWY